MDASKDRELAHLLVLAQEGDGEAYERFLRELSMILRHFLANRLRRADGIEDVLQDTLIAIHQARHTYLPARPLGPWAYAICRHRMVDFIRKRQRISRNEQPLLDGFDWPASPSSQPRETELESEVLEALSRLPERQRDVIKLLKWQGLSVKDTAAKMHLSESAVKVTAFRGYQAIRKMLKANHKKWTPSA